MRVVFQRTAIIRLMGWHSKASSYHAAMLHRHRMTLPALARFDSRWPACVIWGVAWMALFAANETLSLGNLALLLVLAIAISSLWLSAWACVVVSSVSVAAFNWFFVPPRFTFHVQVHRDVLLLMTMLGVSTVISYLMAHLRASVAIEVMHANASEQLRVLGERLRESTDRLAQAQMLREFVASQSGCVCEVVLDAPQVDGVQQITQDGFAAVADPLVQQGLCVCLRDNVALGVGTGRHENQPHLFLPLRGRSRAHGAMVAISWGRISHDRRVLNDRLQHAADLLGLEIERQQEVAHTQRAQQEAQQQSLRNTLLTSISHDYRTPLASLMGAASVLHDQATLLDAGKIQSLSRTVLDEAHNLARMTNNTLQLARLDASPLSIQKDWESVHEFVGVAVRHTRQRFGHRRIEVKLPPALPWVYGDAWLWVQLFENLLENAIQYSPAESEIRVEAVHEADRICIRVIDQGWGIDDAFKSRVFQAFERAHVGRRQADASEPEKIRRGVGVGLAVCQAIAKVHGAALTVQDNQPVGTVMCVCLPVLPQPRMDDDVAKELST